jgi:hypothetical protein
MDKRLELVVVPASGVDRAKASYERLGLRVAVDGAPNEDLLGDVGALLDVAGEQGLGGLRGAVVACGEPDQPAGQPGVRARRRSKAKAMPTSSPTRATCPNARRIASSPPNFRVEKPCGSGAPPSADRAAARRAARRPGRLRAARPRARPAGGAGR